MAALPPTPPGAEAVAAMMDGFDCGTLATRTGRALTSSHLIEAYLPLVAVAGATESLTLEGEVAALDAQGLAVDKSIGHVPPR